MNSPLRPRTEESESEKYHINLVRTMLKQDYSPKQILELSKVEELGLDEAKLKHILAYQNTGKDALGEMGKQTSNALKRTLNFTKNISFLLPQILYIPFTAFRKLEKVDADLAIPQTIVPYMMGHSLLSSMLYDIFPEYPLVVGAITLIDGFYDIYKHKRNRKIEENLSKLEKILDGDSSST